VLHQVGASGHTWALAGGYFAALLTAYYTFRMIFLVTRPNPQGRLHPEEPAGAQFHGHAHHHDGHGVPWPMAAPIALLTLGAVAAGFFGDAIAATLGVSAEHPPIAEMLPAIGVAALGVALAWFDFGRAGADQLGLVGRLPAVHRFFANQWYINELYSRLFVRPAVGLARLCFATETRGIDRAADDIAFATQELAHGVSDAHTGRLQLYVSAAVIAFGLLSLYFLTGQTAGIQP
jgi:NADH-quinone oxidoreductase subunit L